MRVMRGVKRVGARLGRWGAEGRPAPDDGMHLTRDTTALIFGRGAGW